MCGFEMMYLSDTLAGIRHTQCNLHRLQFLVIQPVSLYLKLKVTLSSKEIIKAHENLNHMFTVNNGSNVSIQVNLK